MQRAILVTLLAQVSPSWTHFVATPLIVMMPGPQTSFRACSVTEFQSPYQAIKRCRKLIWPRI